MRLCSSSLGGEGEVCCAEFEIEQNAERKNKFSARQSREVLNRNFYFSLFP